MSIDPKLHQIFNGLDRNNNGVLYNAQDGEPLFIIRANDVLATRTLDFWIESLRAIGTAAGQDVSAKIASADHVRAAINEWQIIHGNKIPD